MTSPDASAAMPGDPAHWDRIWGEMHEDAVLYTPHIGGYTFESLEKTELFLAEKLVRMVAEMAQGPRSGGAEG
jgi:phosphoglycerate dehydrogenase-like enzyme